MRKLVLSLFGIQPGEGARAILMFVYAMFLLSAYLILKPVRNSLFLEKFGPQELVYMYMIIAVFAALIVSSYTKFGTRMSLDKYISVTVLFIISNLIIFWWLISQQYDWLVYVFYVWVSLFGAITTSQFWLLANQVFDAREAKRLFPFIGAGAITGGLVGSKLTGLFAERLGTEALLWICVGFMLAIQGMIFWIWPMRHKERKDRASHRRARRKKSGGTWRLIFSDRYLKLLSGCIALTVMVSTFVDFQFNWVVSEQFPHKDARTAFFGDFFFYLGLLSLALQLLLSSRILRKFGVGVAILVLPIGLFVGAAAIFAWPRLIWSAVLVKISDGSFRYSINKSGFELLYLPIPSAIKSRVKGLMDVVGDRIARGIAGALLLVVTAALGWSIGEISILSGVLILAWIYLAILLRREYSNTFRKALERRSIDIEDVRISLRETGSIESLVDALQSGTPRQVLFALELTYGMKDDHLKQPLAELLLHHSAPVRAEALRQLAAYADLKYSDLLFSLTNDENADVRLEAVRYIYKVAPSEGDVRIQSLLRSDNPELKATLARCALEQGQADRAPLSAEDIDGILADQSEAGAPARREIASALGFASSGHPLLMSFRRLLKDSDSQVCKRTISSAALLKRREYIPDLLRLLAQSKLRSSITDSLVSYGSIILGALRETLVDSKTDILVRSRLPRIIALIGGPEARQTLLSQVSINDISLRYSVIKALGTMRRREPELGFDETFVREVLKSEAREYYLLTAHILAQTAVNGQREGAEFLVRTLKDRRRLRVEQIFRLSGLIYPQQDMVRAFYGLTSASSSLRAGAIEFLDTIWIHSEKELLFGILEGKNIIVVGKLLGIPAFDRDDSIKELLAGSDNWLAACAANVVKEELLGGHREKLKERSSSSYRALSETAQSALDAVGA